MEVEGLEFEVVEVETVQVELEMKADCLKHHLGKNWVLLVHQPLLWPSLLPLPFSELEASYDAVTCAGSYGCLVEIPCQMFCHKIHTDIGFHHPGFCDTFQCALFCWSQWRSACHKDDI